MPQKPLNPELKEKAIELRQAGFSIADIAEELCISQGSVSNLTRDVPKPVISRRQPKGVDIMDKAKTVRVDKEVEELANEVRAKRLRLELDELSERSDILQREKELRVREKELEQRINEERLSGVGEDKGDSDIKELRHELAELREARYVSELARRDGEIADLRRAIVQLSGERRGTTEYDLMLKGFDNLTGELKTWHSDIVSYFLTHPPTPMTEEERRRLTEGIVEVTKDDAELEKLGREVFGSSSPSQGEGHTKSWLKRHPGVK